MLQDRGRRPNAPEKAGTPKAEECPKMGQGSVSRRCHSNRCGSNGEAYDLSDVDWSIRWIVENPTRATDGAVATAARIIPESPNPTRDVFCASVTGLEDNSRYNLDIFDVSGRIVRRVPILGVESASTSVSVEAHDLPNGVYIVLIEDTECDPVSFTLLE